MNIHQLCALTRHSRILALLLLVAMLGGFQHIAAQASSTPKTGNGFNAGAVAGVSPNSSSTTPRMRGTTMAQRKAAAAHAARRHAAHPTLGGRRSVSGIHGNDIAGAPGGAALTPDQLYFSGTYPNYANSPLPNLADTANCSSPNWCGIRKFVDALPGLNSPNLLGQQIPIAVPDQTTFPNTDYYEISLVQYSEKMHSDLPATTLRGYVQTNVTPAATPHYLGPLIIAQTNRPVRIKFTNALPTGTTPGPISSTNGNLFLPVDTSVIGSGLGLSQGASSYLQNRATLHLHGGNTPWISDGTPHQWTVPAGNFSDGSTLYPRGASVQFVPDMFFLNGAVVPQCSASVTANCSGGTAAQLPVGATNDPGPGALVFYYTNQQSARLMFYHDHAFGTTRLNVYAGEAAGYLLQDPVEADLVNGTNNSGVFGTATPAPVIPATEIPLIIQDKTFVPPNPAGGTTVYSIAMLEYGSGYSTPPAVTLTGGGCSTPPTASAVVGTMTDPWGTIVNGAITGITITNPGAGCTGDPAVAIADNGTHPAAYASLATLSQQDPTWDTTLYGGQGNFWYPHVYMPNQWPGNPDGSAVNPMGRWDYASWFWPVFTSQYQVRGDLPCPTSYDSTMVCPGTPTVLNPAPPTDLAGGANLGAGSTASLTPEAFMDTMVVNGTAYPTLTVDPKAYRFRILSVGNDRSLNLSWFQACGLGQYSVPTGVTENCPLPTVTGIQPGTEVGMVPAAPTAGFPAWWPTDGRDGGVPDPAASGPSWIAIGNEGGFLPAPAILPAAPINYEYNRRSVTVTNTSTTSLNLVPAERADVIVDFSQFAGKTLILYNDAPAPYPAFDSRYDYYTGDPDQTGMGGAPTTLAGFGPNTRTVMQVHVNGTTPVPYDPTPLATLLPAAFRISQPVPVVPNPVYNNVYNPTTPYTGHYPHLADTQMTFTPIGGTTPVTLPMRNKTIQELFELDYGRMNATLGTELPLTNFNTQTTIPLGYADPFTEDIYDSANVVGKPVGSLGDGSQVWEVIHNGVDTHAIHFHLYNVQVLDRVGWDGTVRPPTGLDLGWKDTVRMNPLEIDFVALRPMSQQLPFPVPDSVRLLDVTRPAGTDPAMSGFNPLNNAAPRTNAVVPMGWEYVWHCHILGHEENDMMREQVFQVPPQAPAAFSVLGTGSGNLLSFTDMSLSEAGFTIDRADDGFFTTNLVSNIQTLPAQPGWKGTVTWTDTTAAPGATYTYRVRSFKPDADYWNVPLGNAALPNLTSAWTFGTTVQAPTIGANPTALAFGNQIIDTGSVPQSVTLVNSGYGALNIAGISFTGVNPGDYIQTNNCNAALNLGDACTINVTFGPLAIGASAASLSITSNDPLTPVLNIPLTGLGQTNVTITASSATIPYGSAVPTITSTITGLIAPDTAAVLGTINCSTTYTALSPVGSYPVTCNGAANPNYVITYVAGSITVTSAPLTVTVNSASFTYGGALPTLTGTVSGLAAGETSSTVSVGYLLDPAKASVSSNAGTYIGAITASVTGTSASNYTISITPGDLTINKAGLTVTVNPASFTYGGTLPAFTGAVSGLANGDTLGGNVTVSFGTTIAASANAGAYAGAITATLGGSSLGNYLVTNTPAILTINQAPLTVTVTPVAFTYGGTRPTLSGTVSGLVNGDTLGGQVTVSYSTSIAATANASAYTGAITATLGGSSLGNYLVTNTSATLTINQAPLTVTVNPASFTYGGKLPTLTGAVSGLVNGDTLGGKVTVTYGTAVVASANAGTYTGAITATLGGGSLGNYSVSNTPATLTINPAMLTVKAANASIAFGFPLPAFSYSITGFVNGDSATSGAVSGTPSLTTTAVKGSAPGNYPITATLGGLTAGNYTFAFTNSTLTINPGPAVSLSQPSLSFGNQPINTTSATKSVTLTNTGTATLAFSGVLSGPNASLFSKWSNCTGPLAPGAFCTIYVTFKPIATGAATAALTFTDSAYGSPQSVQLSGTGTAPAVTLSQASLSFGNQTVNTASPTLPVTLTNSGSAALTFSLALAGPNASSFSQSTNCTGTLAAGGSCTVNAVFKPAVAGAASAALTFTDNASGSPQSVQLSGTGTVPAVTLSQVGLSFNPQLVNTSSAALPVTLTNSGAGTLTFSVALTGANASSFSQSTNCTGTLAAGGSCTINAVFKPTVAGPASAALTFSDNASGSPQSVLLSGTGTAPVVTLSQTSLTFSSQKVNTTSAAQQVTLTNTGTGTLTFSGALTGPNASSFSKWSNCTGPLAPGASCTVNFTFKPNATGPATAALTLTDNASNSPQSVALNGTGN